MRLTIALVTAALAATAALAQSEPPAGTPDDTFTVAVRTNAPPFAYRRNDKPDADSHLGDYSGFIVDICRRALEEMEIPLDKVRVQGVSVMERFDPIDNDKADMLCAPVTITSDRLKDYLFSMPVFLTGISFITTPFQVDSNRKADIVGVLGRTTALDRLEDGALERLFGKQFATAITESLKGGGPPDQSAVRKLSTYQEGFEMICEGKLVYMLGDIDILAYFIQNDRIGCNAFLSRATISRELLAVVFSPRFVFGENRRVGDMPADRFFMEFQRFVFSLFQNRQQVEKLFETNFPGKSKSRELDAFFRSFMRFPHYE